MGDRSQVGLYSACVRYMNYKQTTDTPGLHTTSIPSVSEISTGQSTMIPWGCGVKTGMAHSTYGLKVWVAGKTLWFLVNTHVLPEHWLSVPYQNTLGRYTRIVFDTARQHQSRTGGILGAVLSAAAVYGRHSISVSYPSVKVHYLPLFRRGACVRRMGGGVCAMAQWHNSQSKSGQHWCHFVHRRWPVLAVFTCASPRYLWTRAMLTGSVQERQNRRSWTRNVNKDVQNDNPLMGDVDGRQPAAVNTEHR